MDHKEAEIKQVGLSWLAELVLWLLLFGMTFIIEISTFQWLPAYHFTAGLCMLRFARAVEHHITELALNLDIELTTTCFLRRAVFWICVCIAGVSILSSMGVATEVMVNTLTSVSFAMGLASQQMLTDMVAGVMVMIWRPFAVGDLIQIEGTDVRGFVYDVLLTETRVDTEANERVSIPNSKIFGQMTRNLSRNPMMRLDVDLDIPLEKDIEMCKKAMLKVLEEQQLGNLMQGLGLDGKTMHEDSTGQGTASPAPARKEDEERDEEESAAGGESEKKKKRKKKKAGLAAKEDEARDQAAAQEPLEEKGGETSWVQALDADNDGVISVSEIAVGFRKGLKTMQSWHRNDGILKGLRDALQNLDKDGDGKLSMSELLALTGKQVAQATKGLQAKHASRNFTRDLRRPRPPAVVMTAIDHEKVSWQIQVWMPTVKHAGRTRTKGKILEDISVALRRQGLL